MDIPGPGEIIRYPPRIRIQPIMFTRFFKPANKVHCTYSTVKPVKVLLVFPGVNAVSVEATTTADLYDVLRYFMFENMRANHFVSHDAIASRFALYYGMRPLSRNHVDLREYNIQDGSVIKIAYHGLLGGQGVSVPQLPTYGHVLECETQILTAEFTVQSEEFDFDRTFNPTGMKLVNAIFESPLFTSGIVPEASARWLHKLIKDVIYLIHDLMESESNRERLKDLKHFLEGRVGDGWSRDILEFSFAYLSTFCSKQDEELVPQSMEEPLKFVKDYLGKFEALKKSPFFKKMYQLGLFILSQSIFSRFGITFDALKYTAMEAAAIKQKFHLGPNLLVSLLNSLIFVCERGYQCYVTGSIEPLYHSGSTYEKWYDDAMEIKRQSRCLACPEAHGFSLYVFLADARSVIEKGKSIVKHATQIGASEKRMVASVLNDLQMILDDNTTRREAQKERTAPFCVCLYGGSSIGKTTITDMLFFQYGKTFDLPIDSEFKYTRNPSAKYWDGFNTSQWFVIMDDIAYMHPNIAAGGDPSLMETIQTNNRVAFVPDQASLDDKGRTPFKARCVVATTNCEDMNAVHYFQTPLAMQRRFPYTIDVQVKPEFAKEACMLDSSKTQVINGQWPSYWIFTVKRPVPDGEERRGQRAKLEVVQIYSDIDEFLAWFSREAVEHERIQNLIATSSDNMKQIAICKQCFKNTAVCECFSVQSGFVKKAKRSLKRCAFHGLLAVAQSDLLPKLMHLVSHQPKVVEELEWLCMGENPLYDIQPDVLLDLSRDDALEQMENFCMGGEDFDAPAQLTLRQRFRSLGEQVCDILGKPEFYGCVIAAVGMLMGAYKLYKTIKGPSHDIVQPQADSVGRAPVSVGDEKPNVWHKDVYEMSSFDVSDRAQCFKSYPIDKIVEILDNNIIAVRTEYEHDGATWAKRFRALCVGGHIYITNLHNLPAHDCTMHLITTKVESGVTRNTKMLLSRDLVWTDEKNDLCAFAVECLPPRKDLTDLFVSKNNRAVLKGYMIKRDDKGMLQRTAVQNYQRFHDFSITPEMKVQNAWVGYPKQVTEIGDCGAMHLAETPLGPQILGLHVAGNDTKCVSTTVTPDMLETIKEHFQRPILRDGAPELSSESATREISTLNRKSTLRWIPAGVAAAYGSYTGWRNTPRSTVKPTFIQDAVLEEGITVKHGKPVMGSYEPWRIAALDMVNPVTDLNLSVLKQCKESFLQDILSGISKEALKEVHVYDDVTALNGAPGVAFVDKMNRNTSMGAPWRTGKKHFLVDLPVSDEYPNAVKFKNEVMVRVQDCITKYENGERYMPVFTGQLKDEALPFKKIDAKKTRVFAAAPADWSFVVRKYLLSVIRLIQTNKYVFETAVGTNAASTQWEELRAYLTQHGEDHMIAGDYGRFDKTMPPCIILAAYDIIREICRAAGYTPKQLLVVQGIAEDTAFPLIDFNGDLVEFYGSNPSGHPLTVIINSLANSLYMRYCYTILSPERSCVHFKRDVALMTYGDDNAMGVRKEATFFNHTAIQQTLAASGITYTMADKEAESIPYIHIDQISFLKRLWRYDEDVGAYLAPLEMDSITKSLTVNTESRSLCPEAHAIAVMASAHSEFFFHGRAEFERGSAMLQRIVKKKDLEVYVGDNTFPTWEQLKKRFWDNSA